MRSLQTSNRARLKRKRFIFSRSFASRSVRGGGSTSKSWILIVSFTFMEELRGRTWISAFVSGGSSQVLWIRGEKHKDGGNSVSAEAKNHICWNGEEQPLSQIHTEAATKLNCVTFERSPGDQPALGADGGGGCSAHPTDQSPMSCGQNPKKTCSLSHLGLIKGMKCWLRAFSELEVWLIAADVTFRIWEVQKEQEDTLWYRQVPRVPV